jgi:hypothetical protein
METVPAAKPQHRRTRTIVAVAFGVIAVLGLLASLVAIWARNVMFDSSKVGDAVATALDEPEVTAALADYLTTQAFLAADVDARVTELLPPALKPLQPAIVGGAQTRVSEQVAKVLALPRVRAVIIRTVEIAHGELVDLLRGDGLVDGVTIVNGEVTVNLLPLVSEGLQAIQGLGLFERLNIPEFSLDDDPATQIAALESATGRDLADDFGQLVVYRSEALDNASNVLSTAQRTMVLVRRSMIAILVLTVISFVISLVVAPRRRRAALVLAIGCGAAFIIARVIVNKVAEEAPTLVFDPAARAAVAATVESLLDGLLALTTIVVVVALVAALAIFLTGDGRTAQRIRTSAGGGSHSARSFATAHREGVALALLAAGVLTIVLAGFSTWPIIIALLFGAGSAVTMLLPHGESATPEGPSTPEPAAS